MAEIEGYWFAAEPRIPRTREPVVIGEVFRIPVPPELTLCSYGLHGSVHPFDALRYATGPLLYRVRSGGTIVTGPDKYCSSERTALASLDATDLLRLFAREQALSVIHLWDDVASGWVVRRWLETGDKTLQNAARSAARNAANSAAYSAALSAAGAADSATDSAADSAWEAAWEATRSAAWAAGWDAAPRRARRATKAADRAWSAAYNASYSVARGRFKEMVEEQFK